MQQLDTQFEEKVLPLESLPVIIIQLKYLYTKINYDCLIVGKGYGITSCDSHMTSVNTCQY